MLVLDITHKRLIYEMEKSIKIPSESLYIPSDYIFYVYDLYMFILFFGVIVMFVIHYGLQSGRSKDALSEGGVFLYAYLDEVEEECGQIEDVIVYVMYFAVFVLWFYFFNIYAAYIIAKHLNWLLSIFCFILILGVVIPSSLLVQLGMAFAQYVRGSGRGTSLLFETLLDFVSVSVIVIRFFVQNIRFVFIFVAFFELYEFSAAATDFTGPTILPHITWTGYWAGHFSNWYWFELVVKILSQVVVYIYYLGHLTITYIAQLAIFIILSFWIFFFLYTTFTFPSADKFFFFKRYALMLER